MMKTLDSKNISLDNSDLKRRLKLNNAYSLNCNSYVTAQQYKPRQQLMRTKTASEEINKFQMKVVDEKVAGTGICL